MNRDAFTLIELLVVIAIIALLLAVLAPSAMVAASLTRRALCASNMHQIATAFTLSPGRMTYPDPIAWPAKPQDKLPYPGIYLCPEADDDAIADIAEYEIWLIDEGIYITFEDTSAIAGLCKVIDRGDYVEYWFDDGWYRDLNDFLFHVTKTEPRVATFRPDLARVGAGRKVSLCYQRIPVKGWEDLQSHRAHDSFTLGGEGRTHFGMNAQLKDTSSCEDIVLLDYVRVRANQGEDVTRSLDESARHLGELNVLWGGYVRSQRRANSAGPAHPPGYLVAVTYVQ